MEVAGTCETSAHTHQAKVRHTTQSSNSYSHIPDNPVWHSDAEYFFAQIRCTSS